MTYRHRHTAATRTETPYRGTAAGARRENPAAHGSLTIVETCDCGATREVAANGRHRELGRWYPAQAR